MMLFVAVAAILVRGRKRKNEKQKDENWQIVPEKERRKHLLYVRKLFVRFRNWHFRVSVFQRTVKGRRYGEGNAIKFALCVYMQLHSSSSKNVEST